MRPELIEDAIQRYYVERPVQLKHEDVQARTKAIEALVSVSQQALAKVQDAKATLIASLQARQDQLLEMRFGEKSISPELFKRKQEQLQDELDAAHTSLAETEQRLTIDAETLRIALDLAEDVAPLYVKAPDQQKRGYNQAFFTKLYALPEWDEDQGQTVVRVSGAELTEPYAVLLADGLAEGVMAEVETMTKEAAHKEKASESQSGSPKPSQDAISYFVKLAEGEGFEPSSEV